MRLCSRAVWSPRHHDNAIQDPVSLPFLDYANIYVISCGLNVTVTHSYDSSCSPLLVVTGLPFEALAYLIILAAYPMPKDYPSRFRFSTDACGCSALACMKTPTVVSLKRASLLLLPKAFA